MNQRVDDIRKYAEVLAATAEPEAEDIVEVLVPRFILSEREIDCWADLMRIADARAGRICASDYDYKSPALAWLSLSEQVRMRACEAYLPDRD